MVEDNRVIEIFLSRVIYAPKWKVIRALTRINKFLEYIPSIKEISVLGKRHNTITTRWRILIDKIPLSWVEEENLLLNQDMIVFKAIEGDLNEFRGQWLFNNHPSGTEVNVRVWVNVDIPVLVLNMFAKNYIRNIVVSNFEAILDGIEQYLISTRYRQFKEKKDIEAISGFGIIGHLYNFYHLEKCLKMLNPEFKMPSQDFMGSLFHLTPSFKLYDITDFRSQKGVGVNGIFIVSTFIPEMLERDRWAVFSKVVKACKIAEKHGIGIVTLGGFCSIVVEKFQDEFKEFVQVPVTTGNTFTVAMTVEGVKKAVKLMDIDLSDCILTIVGGTGDIGSGCARMFVDKVRELRITGRTKDNIKKIVKELKKKKKAKIVGTTDNYRAVRDADIIIAAASVSSSILNIDWFKPGTIVCDVGYPKNISYTPTTREDIFIFSGGLTHSPTSINLPIDIGLPSSGVLYGCFAEAIILALEKRYENYSFGRGNIYPDKVEEIRKIGQDHGFVPAEFWWGERLIRQEDISKIKSRVKS